MTEPEKTKQPATVEATPAAGDLPEEQIDTPMLAVWITLAAIIFAGIYGLYLGATAQSKQKSEATTTSALEVQAPSHVASAAIAGWSFIGRQS